MPLLWLSLAFLGGIFLGGWLGWSLIAWLVLVGLAFVILLLPRLFAILPHRFSIPALRLPDLPSSPVSSSFLLLVLALGAFRYQLSQPQLGPKSLAWYNDRDIPFVVEGILVAPPDERDTYTGLRLRVDRFHPVGELLFTPVEGLLLARVPPGGNWRYGDRLRLQGLLSTPPHDEDFSYRDYLARQDIFTSLSCAFSGGTCVSLLQRDQGNPVLSAIYSLRDHALHVLQRIMPDPEASLLAGILLGIESGIPQDVQEAFRETGTAHIIAISGFNITILAGLLSTITLRLLGKRRRFLAAGLCATLVAVYAILVGASAAVVRAAILGGLSLFARQLGRQQQGLNSLALVAALMALFDPYVLWDVGFQLSFAATLGLVLYAEPWKETFLNWASRYLPLTVAQRLAGPVGEYFLFTLAAQVTTLPVVLYHFQRLSLVSLIANPLILPVQPLVMVLGGLAVILGLVVLPLGQLFAYLTWPFVAYTIRMVELLAQFPTAAVTIGPVSPLVVALFYLLLVGWTLTGSSIRAWAFRHLGSHSIVPACLPILILIVLASATMLTWQAAFTAPDGLLHLTMLDVGSGDGILIQTPAGRYLLVDGGPSPSRLSDALGRRLPLTGRRFDYLVVAATGDNQLAALPRVLERFVPDQVLWSGSTAGSPSARQLRQFLAEKAIPITLAQPQQSLDLGGGASLSVLSAGSRGAVLWLEWLNFHALLPIGMDFDSLEALMNDKSFAEATVLSLAESGYAPLNPPEWIARWKPQLILLSVGAGDRQGLPDVETLQAVQGYTLLRTDTTGWIHLSTDGKQLWVEVERR